MRKTTLEKLQVEC